MKRGPTAHRGLRGGRGSSCHPGFYGAAGALCFPRPPSLPSKGQVLLEGMRGASPRPSPRPAASHLCCLSSRGASSCWRLPAPSSFPLWGPDSQARPAAQRDPPAPGPLLLLRTRGQAGSLGNPRASQLTVCKHRTEGNNEDRGAFWSADLSI